MDRQRQGSSQILVLAIGLCLTIGLNRWDLTQAQPASDRLRQQDVAFPITEAACRVCARNIDATDL